MLRHGFVVAALQVAAALVVVAGVSGGTVRAAEEVWNGPVELETPAEREVEARFRRLGAGRGLTAGAVHHVMQDRRGFVWVSTRVGVFRYDGHRFTAYQRDAANPNSPAGSATWVTMEDRRGWIWMGHLDEGLTVYVPERGRFHRFEARPGAPGALQSATVTALHEDGAGRVWVGTDGGGLHRVRLPQEAASPQGIRFVAFRADPSDPRALSSDKVVDIAEDSQGQLWLATFGGGLNRFDPESDHFDAFRHDAAGETILPGDHLMSVARGARGGFWVGGKYSGLSYFDPQKGRAYRVPLPEAAPRNTGRRNLAGRGRSVEDPEATFVWRVRVEEQTVWVATYGQGLVRLRYELDPDTGVPRIRQVVHHVRRPDEPHGLPDDFVMDVFRDRTGLLWIATDNEGVALLNDRSPAQPLGWQLGGRPVREAQVSAFLRAVADSTRWACTNYGLFLLGEKEPTAVLPQLRARGLRTNERFFDLVSVAPGRYWAGTNEGIVEIVMRDGRVQAARRVARTGALRVRRLLHIGEQVWIATSGDGLWRAHLPTGRVQALPAGGVPRVLNLAAGPGRRVCAATYGAGVACFNSDTAGETAPVFYTRDDGLPGDIVRQVAFDEAGRLWAVTDGGLAHRRTPRGRFVPYRLPIDYFEPIGEVFAAPGGALLLAGARGLLRLDPGAAATPRAPVPVAVTDIRILGRPIESTREAPWVREVRLPAGQRSIMLEVAAMDFATPESNRLAYRLASGPADTQAWRPLTQRSAVSFFDLAPGRHVFEVRRAAGAPLKGASRVKPIEASVARLSLVVDPFLWETTWFRALAVLLGVSALGGLWAYRQRQRQHLQRTRQRIADDLHDDIGSKMSSVALMLDVSGHQPEAERHETVRRAALTAREVMGDLRDAVWVVDTGNDSLRALAARLRRVAGALAPQRCTLSIDEPLPERPLRMEARRHLFLFFKEALHNATRHAGEARIDVRLRVRDHQLSLTVVDEGPGFDPSADPSAQTEGRGLRTMRSRADALGAHFTLDTAPGRGTVIALRVPLAQL